MSPLKARVTPWAARLAIGALVAGAVAQLVYLAPRIVKAVTPAAPTPDLREGTSIASLEVVRADGSTEQHRLRRDRPTLLLAFHSECAHCLAVAPTWREWVAERPWPRPLDVIAVTRELPPTGKSYLMEHGIDVPAVSVRAERGTIGARLAKKTPWLYGVDRTGTVIFTGHGSELDDAVEALFPGVMARPREGTARE